MPVNPIRARCPYCGHMVWFSEGILSRCPACGERSIVGREEDPGHGKVNPGANPVEDPGGSPGRGGEIPMVKLDRETLRGVDRLPLNFSVRPGDLKYLRKRQGLSMAEVAKVLSVTEMSVWRWEHGKARPQRSHLLKLVEIFPQLLPVKATKRQS